MCHVALVGITVSHYFGMLSSCWSLALRYGGTREFVGTLHLMKKDVCGGFYLAIERDRSIERSKSALRNAMCKVPNTRVDQLIVI